MVLSNSSWKTAGLLRQGICIYRQKACGLLLASQQRYFTSETSSTQDVEFDEKMLEILVCPLTKKPLRYDREKNELISDSIKVAYPIVNGIPNLVPQDGRMLEQPEKTES